MEAFTITIDDLKRWGVKDGVPVSISVVHRNGTTHCYCGRHVRRDTLRPDQPQGVPVTIPDMKDDEAVARWVAMLNLHSAAYHVARDARHVIREVARKVALELAAGWDIEPLSPAVNYVLDSICGPAPKEVTG